MKKTICIHGHFYQPPRENPWLEYIEIQSSAYPYHDWNERITNECYLPNSASRLVNDENKIIDIVNNYSKISFNFGPSLLEWMEKFKKDVYKAIQLSDDRSVREKKPSAIAQCYNHMIMPLANNQDKKTQIIWAIESFVHTYKRMPTGIWLPETAVDLATLEALAREQIAFTILAQHQIKEIKKISEDKWQRFDKNLYLKSPFLCRLPSGKTIYIFVYDGDISFKISFSDLLGNGTNFAKDLLNKFRNEDFNQIVSIATDGETFGHHKKFGDMALASCLRYIQSQNVEILSYNKYLEDNPALYEVKINENTSWSCAHGVERWRSDCSCNIGKYPNGNQKWRKVLRESLDFIRDKMSSQYESCMKSFNIDPWQIRNDYIKVIVDRSKSNVDKFIKFWLKKEPSHEEKEKILKALEMQRQAMLMYTSCGWFFDDISNIETVQVMRYAKRALELSEDVNLEKEFLNRLEKAKSNEEKMQNGKVVYERFVNLSMVSLEHVGAHFATALLFENFEKISQILCYEIKLEELNKENLGSNIFLNGKLSVTSLITYQKIELNFVSLFIDPFSVFSYVENFENQKEFKALKGTFETLFKANELEKLKELFLENKQHKHIYSFWDLFKDERQKIFQALLKNLLTSFKEVMREKLEKEMQMICEIKTHNMELPEILNRSLDLYFYYEILELVEKGGFQEEKCAQFIEKAHIWSIKFKAPHIVFEAEKKLHELMDLWKKSPVNIHLIEKIIVFLNIFYKKLEIPINLWFAQNVLFSIMKEHKSEMETLKEKSKPAQTWLNLFYQLSEILNMKV